MKRIITFAALLVFTITQCFAQEKKLNDTIKISPVPFNIDVFERSFEEPIRDYKVSPSFYYEAFIFSRQRKVMVPKNRIEVYRNGSNEKLWEKSYDESSAVYIMTKYGVLEQTANSIKMLNYNTGEKNWSIGTGNFSGIIDDILIVRGTFGTVEGYSLATGKKKWKTDIDYKGGLCYAQVFDDKYDFLVTDNVYKIDWKTGNYEYLDAKTSIADKGAIALNVVGAMVAVAAIGFTASAGGGYYYVPYYYPSHYLVKTRNNLYFPSSGSKICGISSKIVTDGNRNYFADRNSVLCFDNDLNPIWNVESPNKKAYASELFVKGDKLYMIDCGYAIKNGQKKELGIPYFAEFNASNGALTYYHELADEKTIVKSFFVEDDNVRIMFDNSITTISLTDKKSSVMNFDVNHYGKLYSFVNKENYFILNEGTFFTPLDKITKSAPVLTYNGYLLDISSKDGNPKPICSKSNYFAKIGEWKDLTVVCGEGSNKEVWCLNNEKAVKLVSNVGKVWMKENMVFTLLNNGSVMCFDLNIQNDTNE